MTQKYSDPNDGINTVDLQLFKIREQQKTHQQNNYPVIWKMLGLEIDRSPMSREKRSLRLFASPRTHSRYRQNPREFLSATNELVGGWTNPSEKICSSNWIMKPQGLGWKYQNMVGMKIKNKNKTILPFCGPYHAKYLSCHQLDSSWRQRSRHCCICCCKAFCANAVRGDTAGRPFEEALEWEPLERERRLLPP